MIISEKQIMQLMEYLRDSLDGNLFDRGVNDGYLLLDKIIEQQSEELINISDSERFEECSENPIECPHEYIKTVSKYRFPINIEFCVKCHHKKPIFTDNFYFSEPARWSLWDPGKK